MASVKLIALLLLAATSAEAQSFSFGDLFGQAGKQKKYYLQQIAAYQVFQSELKQGYNVIKHGLSGIRDINTAELNAHSTYYTSLKQVSGPVKNSEQVQDIFDWQVEINNSFNQSFNGLTDDEQTYISTVKAGVLNECNADLTDLDNLLTAGKLEMTDDERLKRLAKIHTAMLDKYQFTRSFCNAAKLLIAQRQQSNNETQTLKSIYETH
ncbi:hypothetical protein [Mucilaginibacter paludis]|uniref:Uncharacterized protein n=1 Tax=Mucilaginibacter paludis DSM 18603 TaxID=714943 RepID=H1XZ43_9SPHI|nr:hypothetical protein [Mucilaginibacter paludis]EHQ24628.1 hypothetical protein Mucpa_0434 [Mucilaginibacter paludis DSM 18603]